jgi:protein-tyrosine phosphatase
MGQQCLLTLEKQGYTGLSATTSVLFVCLGNICRSPTAEGVFRAHSAGAGLSGNVHIDSAGTAAYHVGSAPDPRAQAAALRRGIDLSAQRARQVEASDFTRFDYLLAMDRENLANLEAICPPGQHDRIHLFLEFAVAPPVLEVPDPYYGSGDGFERVLDLVEAASEGLIADIQKRLRSP